MTTNQQKHSTVLIIGLGRFGQLLAQMLKPNFKVLVNNRSDKKQLANKLGVTWTNYQTGIKQADTIFYCVPISEFAKTLRKHVPYYGKTQQPKLIIDVLSVKMYAKKIFDQYLPDNCQAMLTHPMFGPDSVREKGLTGLPIIIDQYTANQQNYQFWKTQFQQLKLNVIEMSAQQHDQLAAKSQGVTHFIGRVLQEFKFQPTPIDTIGALKLHQVMDQTCNDTWQLFHDLQTKNPYTKKMRVKLGKSLDKIYNKLLPKRINKDHLIFGIQGGKGSFNHQALDHYVTQHNIKNYKIKYLYTTAKVLSQLHQGNIDYGLFAIHNSVGGVVEESIHAMAQYKFKIIEEFAIAIRHFLMKRKDIDQSQITTIMTHPQVIKQCQNNIKKHLSPYKVTSGTGDLIDHAQVAKQLAAGKIDTKIAVMGPRKLAQLYDLDIMQSNLQDQNNNLTSFLMVANY